MRALSIAWKDLRQTYRSLAGVAMMLVAPLLLAFVLGAAFGSGSSFSLPAVRTAVADLDQGAAGAPAAGATITGILSSPELSDLLAVTQTQTAEEARALVDGGEADVAVIIPAGLTAALTSTGADAKTSAVQIYKDPTLNVGPAIVTAIVRSAAQSLNGARAAAAASAQLAASEGITDPEALSALASATAQAFALRSQAETLVALAERTPEISGVKDQKSPNVASQVLVGMMLFFMLFGASTPARSILDEHREGTLPRLFTTPTPRSWILGGKYLAVFLVVLVQSVALLIAGRLLLGARWGEPGPVLVLALTGSLVSASLGLVTVSFAKTPGPSRRRELGHLRFPRTHQRELHRRCGPRRNLRRRAAAEPARLADTSLERPTLRRILGKHHRARGRGLGIHPGLLRRRDRILQKALRMRHVWYIATKDLLENRRDKLAALFTLVLPVIFTVVLGVVIGQAESAGLPLALADGDGSPAAQQLVARLEESSLLEVKIMTADEVDKAVHDEKAAAGLIIPEGFGAAVTTGKPVTLALVRAQTSTGARSVVEAVQDAVSQLNAGMLAAQTAAEQVSLATGATVDEALVATARSLADAHLDHPAVVLEAMNAGSSSETIAGGFDQSSSGSMVNWVLFSLLGVAATMVWERRQGLLRRLSVAGVRAREIVAGKMMAMVMITFLQQLLLVLLGQLAFGVDYFSSPLALFVTMISLSLLASAFGLLISSVFRSEQAVIATTVISAQLLAAMGGAWFPLEITGSSFSTVAHFLPSAWVMDSLHGIILKDWGIGDVLYPMGIVWIWILVLFALGVWRYRPD